MAQMPPLRQIINNTPADADDVRYNYSAIESNLSNEVINRDGSVSMQAPLSGPPGTQPDHYVTVGQLGPSGGDGLGIPTGVVMPYAGSQDPIGWALCDGREVSSTDPLYAPLFAAIGYTYGDPGSGNFNLPDLRDRTIAGAGREFATGDAGGDADGVALHSHETAGHDHGINHTHTAQHDHLLSSHSHSMNHGHTGNMSSSGSHDHSARFLQSDASQGDVRNFARPYSADGGFQEIIRNDGAHWHSFQIYNYTGTTATGGGGRTALESVTTSSPSSSRSENVLADVSDAGTAGGNWPPYLAMNYLIKL